MTLGQASHSSSLVLLFGSQKEPTIDLPDPEGVYGASSSVGHQGLRPLLLATPSDLSPTALQFTLPPGPLHQAQPSPGPGRRFISVNRNQQMCTVIYFNVFLRTEWKFFFKKKKNFQTFDSRGLLFWLGEWGGLFRLETTLRNKLVFLSVGALPPIM